MKQILLILLFGSFYSSAQFFGTEGLTPKNEIGLPFFSARNLELYGLNKNQPTIVVNYMVGAWYKRHLGKNIFRTNLELIFDRVNEWNNYGTGYWSKSATRKGAEISVGYERKLFTNKWQPFLGTDIGYAYWRERGLASSSGCFTCYMNLPYNENYHQVKLTFLMGLRYLITPKFSLTMESNYGLYSTFGAYGELLNLRFNPIQLLGVSYHF